MNIKNLDEFYKFRMAEVKSQALNEANETKGTISVNNKGVSLSPIDPGKFELEQNRKFDSLQIHSDISYDTDSNFSIKVNDPEYDQKTQEEYSNTFVNLRESPRGDFKIWCPQKYLNSDVIRSFLDGYSPDENNTFNNPIMDYFHLSGEHEVSDKYNFGWIIGGMHGGSGEFAVDNSVQNIAEYMSKIGKKFDEAYRNGDINSEELDKLNTYLSDYTKQISKHREWMKSNNEAWNLTMFENQMMRDDFSKIDLTSDDTKMQRMFNRQKVLRDEYMQSGVFAINLERLMKTIENMRIA